MHTPPYPQRICAPRTVAPAGLPSTCSLAVLRRYLDVTSPTTEKEMRDPQYLAKLAKWLVTEQPITLAINGDDAASGYPMALQLFEQVCWSSTRSLVLALLLLRVRMQCVVLALAHARTRTARAPPVCTRPCAHLTSSRPRRLKSSTPSARLGRPR